MVGAPLVRIRPDRPTVDHLPHHRPASAGSGGSPATVDFDSNAGAPLTGRVA